MRGRFFSHVPRVIPLVQFFLIRKKELIMFFVMENGGLYSEFVALEAAVDMAEMVFGYVDPQGEA